MTLKRTPLFEEHQKLGGKIVSFAGWELPVLYSGVIPEHNAVRQAAGLFDVSHMGEIFVSGPEAEASIDSMTCNDVKKLNDGGALYSAITTESGGIVDDIIIYRYSSTNYLICVNASNIEKDFEWFKKHNRFNAEYVNKSSEYGQIALQGPQAEKILSSLKGASEVSKLKYFHFADCEIEGIPTIVARTGYTGEDGFEIFAPANLTVALWRMILEKGQNHGLIPAGLGARDSLRLEACYPLHGHELSEEISAIESGLGWIVKPQKGDFTGKDVLAEQKKSGSPRSLAAFFVEDPGIVREGSKVFSKEQKEIGVVTSGTKTPTINKSLGLCLLKSEDCQIGNEIYAEVRGKLLKCCIVPKPFYKKP